MPILRIVQIALAFIFCISGYAQTIDPVLLEKMEQCRDNEKIEVFVVMRQQIDQVQLDRQVTNFSTRAERRDFVVNELMRFAEVSQYNLHQSLEELQRNGLVSEPKVLWIANAVFFEATRGAILSLAERSDIMVIGFNQERSWLPDGEESNLVEPIREITTNVTQVNADQVWNMGYTGQGVVVAVIDTGVNYNHLDLADHLWDGGTEFPNHGFDVYNDDNDPLDDHGHGTHCAGTICGDGTAGSQTGIAPDATLMCIKCLSSTGRCSDLHVINSMQWAVEHGCDIMSMSLSGHEQSGAEQTIFRNACVNTLTSGVIASMAAGNEGNKLDQYPIPDNVGLPGGCPPPYLDPDQQQNAGGLSCSVCVGAVNSSDEAAYFSSHGPRTWVDSDYADYPYTAGSQSEFGLIRPDVCAPGISIKSAYHGSNTGYTTRSGTSMATPCVAGCMALMLSKNFDATPAELCRILEETAVPLSTGKSNIYGCGRVDALAAVNALYSPLKLESYAISDELGNNDGKLNAGEAVTIDFILKNNTDVALDSITMTLYTESDYVTITNGIATLPHFEAGQTQTVEDVFAFTLSDDAPAKTNIPFTAKIFVDGEPIESFRMSAMVYGHTLRLVEVVVLNDNNGNGLLEADETANLHIVVSNVGNEPADSVVGMLSTLYPYITINETVETYGDLEINNQASADFIVTLADTTPDGYSIDFTLDLVDAEQKHTQLEFELWSKAITLMSNPAEGGTLSGAGYYGQGQPCTITATANDGYAFVCWTLDGTTVSNLPTYTFTVTDEAEYVANFAEGSSICTVYFDLFDLYGDGWNDNYLVVDYGDGNVEQFTLESGSFASYSREIATGSTLNMTWISGTWINECSFDIKFENGVPIYHGSNLSSSYHHQLNINCALAHTPRAITAVAVPEEGGAVEGEGIYESGTVITLTATPNDGYSFCYWSENGQQISTDTTYSFMVTTDLDLEAHFSLPLTISVTTNMAEGGSAIGAGVFAYGTTCTLTATPNEGYLFLNWSRNGEVVSCNVSYSFTVTEDAEIEAAFMLLEGALVGVGEATNMYMPSYSYFQHALSQQIYTPDEIGVAGNITSIAYFNAGNTKTRSYDIYLVHTEKEIFDNNSDWIVVSEADRVYTGSVTLTKGYWSTIVLDRPFVYDGTSNLAVVIDDNSGNWTSAPHMSCRVFNTVGYQAIYDYSDSTNYNPAAPTSYIGTVLNVKNQLLITTETTPFTQTVPLLAGTNWLSFNAEITLEDLQTALVEALPDTSITIKSRTQNTAFTTGTNQWKGTLNALDVSQMYMISVGNDCEITLEGMPVNPSEHSVTIHNGANWIAFPFIESMSVSEAFAGFAVNGDVIKSRTTNSSYINGQWRGGLNTLEPGRGYIYKSNATEDRIFTFPIRTR